MTALEVSKPELRPEEEDAYVEITITPRMTEREREAAIARIFRRGRAISERR